jgi:hypothetical protein
MLVQQFLYALEDILGNERRVCRLVMLTAVKDLMATDYFDKRTLNRQRLFWALATREQLARWEPLVASSLLQQLQENSDGLDDTEIWLAQMEHHFVLVAARNLVQALELAPASRVVINPTMRAELIEGRDLLEHWSENMPIFNVTPRPAQPRYRSGKDFAARNPRHRPYWWLGWSNKTGARLMPHVHAPALHDLLDAVEKEVLADDESLKRFVPPRAPSPWVRENGEWWPK